MLELKTKRLLLRDFQDDDRVAFQQFGNRTEALQYYPQTPTEWSAHAANLVKKFEGWRLEIPREKYALAIISGGSFVGVVSIRVEAAEQRQGSVGCGLAYDHWSKGYASEAMAAVITLGFEDLNLHRIYAETISDNRAAVSMAMGLGLRVEGELRENQYFKGRWWNTTILALLKSEWREKSAGLRSF